MKDSIFYSSMRAFFVALCSVIGIVVGFVLILLLFMPFSETSSNKLTTSFSPEIVANAEGERKVLSNTAPVVLKINIDGIIGISPLNNETLRSLLIESREDPFEDNRIKAILLNINSPGGTVFDSVAIYQAIKSYKEKYKVPVYAFVDGLCASGGMYIAMAADKVYSSDSSILGSVGVITPSFMNFSQLIEKIGIQTLTVSAGEDKDALNPLRPWKPGESDNIQGIVDYYYKQFVDIVVANRPAVSREKLVNDYGAKIFNPQQSKEIGFIDAADYTLSQTLKELVKTAGLEDNAYQVVELQKKTWLNELFPGAAALFKGQIVHHIQFSPDLDSRLMNQFLYLYRPNM